jgi:hypothetical protein
MSLSNWKNRKKDRYDTLHNSWRENDRGRSSNDDRSGRDSFDNRMQFNDRRSSYNNDRRDSHLDNAKALAVMSMIDTWKNLL